MRATRISDEEVEFDRKWREADAAAANAERDRLWGLILRLEGLAAANGWDEYSDEQKRLRAELRAALGFDDDGEGGKR